MREDVEAAGSGGRAEIGAENEPEVGFSRRVIRTVRRIPYGRVLAYGDVAALLGAPRAARGVGQVLGRLPEGSNVPWWRVVNRNGEISIRHFGAHVQRMLLEQEGVSFGRGGRIDMSRFRWRPDGWAPPGEDR